MTVNEWLNFEYSTLAQSQKFLTQIVPLESLKNLIKERDVALDALTLIQEEWLLRVKDLESKNYALNQNMEELSDLLWLRNEVNKRVIPGESDTADAARQFFNESMKDYKRLEDTNKKLVYMLNSILSNHFFGMHAEPYKQMLENLEKKHDLLSK